MAELIAHNPPTAALKASGYVGSPEGDISGKMDLALLDPTAEEIAAMPNGQLYGDTFNHKAHVKGGQSFYDTDYIDSMVGDIEALLSKL